MIDNRIGDDFYLLPIARPGEGIPQRRISPHPPSRATRGLTVKAGNTEFEPPIRREKGALIDIYA